MWMLFFPEQQKERRHHGKYSFGTVDFGMTGRTKRKHQVKNRFTGQAVRHDDGTPISARGVAHAAPVTITLQHGLSQSTEGFVILPSERVAGRTKAKGKHLHVSAWTVHYPLLACLQRAAPATYLYEVWRLMLSSPASLVFDSPNATRRHSSFACTGLSECFRPT